MSFMRKILAILLISVHLAGNTEAGQLLKLPQLVTHYNQHHQQDPAVDFIDFIVMHYAGDDGTTADDEMDNQLPCHNRTNHTIAVVYSPMVKELPSVDFSCCISKVFNSRLLTGVSSKHVSLILQPPRLG